VEAEMPKPVLQCFFVAALCRLIVEAVSFAICVYSQSTTGTLLGTVIDGNGLPLSGVTLRLTGHPAASRIQVSTNARGEFEFVLPCGDYEISADSAPAVALHIYALQVSYSTLVIRAGSWDGTLQSRAGGAAAHLFESWRVTGSAAVAYPDAYSLSGLLLSREPASVTQPSIIWV
jgi:carboxypeptidase family protein